MFRLIAAIAGLAAGMALLTACADTATAKKETPIPPKVVVSTPTLAPAATLPPVATSTSGTAGGTSVAKQWTSPPAMAIDANKAYKATIKTTMGDVEVELLAKDAPLTVNNFVFLAREGFYDNVKFHRIIKGFMIQTGDPTGTGAGGPGYRFRDEPIKSDYKPGTLAMANAGPNTNGSQFFIMHGDYSDRLPKNYTIFGQVTKGQDVVDKIAAVPVRASPQGEPSVPTQDVRIVGVTIQES